MKKVFLVSVVSVMVSALFSTAAMAKDDDDDSDTENPKVALVGGFAFDVAAGGGVGGMVGLEYRLSDASTGDFAIYLFPRVAFFGGWTATPDDPEFSEVGNSTVDLTANIRLRWNSADGKMAFLVDLGGGMRSVSIDTYYGYDDYTRESYLSGSLNWGGSFEYRVSKKFRLAAFYYGGVIFNQVWGVDAYGPLSDTGYTHQVGGSATLFF